jgi:MFS family permease
LGSPAACRSPVFRPRLRRLHPSGLLLLLLIYLGFVSLGLPDGTLGVAWPEIARELTLPFTLAGVVTTVVTLLSAASGFASGRILARFRTGPVVLVSCSLSALALLLVAHAHGFAFLLLAAVPLGLGAGAVDAALNGFVAHHYSGRHMNWLHACWGLGAATGPVVMGAAIASAHSWRGGYLALAGVQAALALLFLGTLSLWRRVPDLASASAPVAAIRSAQLPADSLAGWLSPALFMVYVALEGGTGLWAATILTRARGFTAEHAAWSTAAFYAAITLGRIGVGFAVDRRGNRRLIAAGATVALGGAFAFAVVRSPLATTAALVVFGLGLAPIYPGLMHEVPRRFAAAAAQTVIGRQSGAAFLGMALLPAALGALAGLSLAAIPWVLIGGTALLLVGIRRLDRLG